MTSLISLQQQGCRTYLVTTTSMLTRKYQKTQKIDENINIERENLNIFWTTWETLMKFSGKMWLNIKSHKKTRLHSVCRKCKFGKSYKYCQNLKWKNTFRYFRVFDFGYRTKSKTRKSQKTIFFSKSISWPLRFCLSSLLSFLNLKLQLLSKFEVKEHFPRFPSFWFWV